MAIVISSTAPRGYVLSITVTDGHDRSTLNQDVSELLNSSRCSEFQEGDEIQLWIENSITKTLTESPQLGLLHIVT